MKSVAKIDIAPEPISPIGDLNPRQVEALHCIKNALAQGKRSGVVWMVPGAGKSVLALLLPERLRAGRTLILVENGETRRPQTAHPGLPKPQWLETPWPWPETRISVTTPGRLSLWLARTPVPPPDPFDLVLHDDISPSSYVTYREQLNYFDAVTLGFVSSPAREPLDFFKGERLWDYNADRAIADGIRVDLSPWTLVDGPEAGPVRLSRFPGQSGERQWHRRDTRPKPGQLREVTPGLIGPLLHALRHHQPLFFPQRTILPKTLILTSQSLTEPLVRGMNAEFSEAYPFCAAVRDGSNLDEIAYAFRHFFMPRAAVTTPARALSLDLSGVECVVAAVDIASHSDFDKIIGRAAAALSPSELLNITPDAAVKSHLVLIDAVGTASGGRLSHGVLESCPELTPQELLAKIEGVQPRHNCIASLAGRTAALKYDLNAEDEARLIRAADGKPHEEIIHALIDVLDRDITNAVAAQLFGDKALTAEGRRSAKRELIRAACAPFHNAEARRTLLELWNRSADMGLEQRAARVFSGKPREITERFRQYIKQHWETGDGSLSPLRLRELHRSLVSPPFYLNPERIWRAYGALKKKKVRPTGVKKTLTNIISLVQYERGVIKVLEPFADLAQRRFSVWLNEGESGWDGFNPEQLDYLDLILRQFILNGGVTLEDLDDTPFREWGGSMRMYQLFGPEMEELLEELTEILFS